MVAAAESFVCVADEVWRLQRGSEADCVFFQRAVNGGERITDGGTRQGTWVLSAAGDVLARVNTRDPERVLGILEAGLAAWEALAPERRALSPEAGITPEHRWEDSCPADGLVLERIARDVAAEGLDAPASDRWNRDHAWFARDEIRDLVPATAAVGDTLDLSFLARRLARFHLVDNVRGQSLPYALEEVQEARLAAEVVARDGARVELALSGATRAAAEGPWQLGANLWKPAREHPHGIATELAGRATWDAERRSFERLELVAVGSRWGRTQNNARRDAVPGPIAFHLQPARPGARVPPAFVAVYDADWITAPAVPTWLESPAECGLPVDQAR